jgi:hypothetical protein
MWQRNKDTSVYASTSPALGGGGFVSGTQSPGGSDPAHAISYVNNSPWAATNNTMSLNRYHPRHLYGRRGHTQGGLGGGGGSSLGGFSKLLGGGMTGGTINTGTAVKGASLFNGTGTS